jgi:hypothetical protein
MAEQIGQVLRVAGIVNGKWTFDPDRFLVLRDEKSGGEHDQPDEDSGEDAVVPRPVLPMSFAFRRHIAQKHIATRAPFRMA